MIRHLLSHLYVDKHKRYASSMASSQHEGTSALFSSEKSGKSVPFSHARDEKINEHTAGDEMFGLETNYGSLTENLDELSEEQLDELLREALDINQRLRSLERRQTSVERMDDHKQMNIEENGSTGFTSSQSHFLPPIQQTKTSLVTQNSFMKGIMPGRPERVSRQKKSTVM